MEARKGINEEMRILGAYGGERLPGPQEDKFPLGYNIDRKHPMTSFARFSPDLSIRFT